MRIASWNVNSVRQRTEALTQWLARNEIDVALLQETKVTDDAFPKTTFADKGYEVHVFGEAKRNGVALISRAPVTEIARGLAGDEDDDQARWLEATVGGVRLACVYLPNGTAPTSPNFTYKLNFLERLAGRLEAARAAEEPLLVGGDFNVAPAPVDVYDAKELAEDVCYRLEVRAGWRRLVHAGYYDVYRALEPEGRAYSWWPFQGRGFELGEGMRIDHFLAAPEVMDRMQAVAIDSAPRADKGASDHAPIWCELG